MSGLVVVTVCVVMTVTAYTDCDGGMRCDGITASGEGTRWGVVSGPPVMPLGTELDIEGLDGLFVVLDRGRGIRGSRLDLWMGDRAAALGWGVRRLLVCWREVGEGGADLVTAERGYRGGHVPNGGGIGTGGRHRRW